LFPESHPQHRENKMEDDNIQEFPYTTLANHSDYHSLINTKYEEAKETINNILTNGVAVGMVHQQALQPVGLANEQKSQYIQDGFMQNISYLAQKFAQAPTALYGNYDASVYGKAVFLDRFNTLRYPEHVFDHISEGKATSDQIKHLNMFFPDVYADYKNKTLMHVATTTEDLSQEDRLATYGYTGIETSPMVSAASAQNAIRMNMMQQQEQAQAAKRPTPKMPKENLTTQTFAPFTSPQGKQP